MTLPELRQRLQRSWGRFGVALALVAMAAALRLWPLQSLDSKLAWLTFYPAVMVAAILGGLTAGLLATALAVLTVTSLWPLLVAQPFLREPADWLGLAVFVMTGGMISSVAEAMCRAQVRAMKAQQEAERANRAKDSFLATMSHEIRTPLNGMLGMLELLSLTPLDREQEETLKAAWDSGRSLLRIVNDILEWSRIEEGKLHLAPHPTSIPQVLREVVNTYSRVASAKGLVLRQRADERLAPAHLVDALRLSQILNNFVSNAIKFTREGEVELRAESLDRRDGRERLRLSVRDSGIGIPREVQAHLFQRYRQASADTTRMYGGTGLGLAICRRLAELMEGAIELESAPGRGSTFSLILTLPESDAPAEVVRSPHLEVEQRAVTPLHRGGDGAPRVLVVDDNPINRDLLSRQLRLLGLRTLTAEHGAEALPVWTGGDVAVVITDCHMPKMDGYALARAIRAGEAAGGRPRIPVIAWTANALPEEVVKCQAAGMDDTLVKPVTMAQLRGTLARWLGIEAPEAGPSAPQAAGGERHAAPLDGELLQQLLPDGAARTRLLHEFRAHLHSDRAALLEVLARGDHLGVERTAHRMKGASSMVGANDLAQACAAVEQAARRGDLEAVRTAEAALAEALGRLETFISAGGNEDGERMNAKELNLLVVEDDAFQRRLLVDMLRSLGAGSVNEAGNGRQALDLLRGGASARPVDIALCDLNMPEMDGLEFLRHVGSGRHQLSIVILSAMDKKVLASVGRMTAMYGIRLLGVVEKPMRLEQLRSLLASYQPGSTEWTRPAATATFTLEEIRQGIRARQFEPFFQPKVDCKTGKVVGAEALARWVHPQHGVVSPQAFIPLLEESGNIDDLTFLMLEKAVAACRSVRDAGHPLTVSVNLSLVSLDDTALADRITQVVQEAGLEPHHVVLEITETVAMTNAAHALENLARLRMRGFGLSIDDYGTGYSTMQQLTRIAFSELKIDQSFVREVADNDALRIVVESSIDMARKLRVVSVAEGVETQEDWDAVRSMGCDTAQGYFVARPMAFDAFVDFCAKKSA